MRFNTRRIGFDLGSTDLGGLQAVVRNVRVDTSLKEPVLVVCSFWRRQTEYLLIYSRILKYTFNCKDAPRGYETQVTTKLFKRTEIYSRTFTFNSLLYIINYFLYFKLSCRKT